jgi:integrase
VRRVEDITEALWGTRVSPATVRASHRIATYRTLIALLAVTGMRVGEAIALDTDDFDETNGLLTIRHGKFGKSANRASCRCIRAL